MGKKHKPEEIIGKLREVGIVLGQGGTTAEACRRIAISEQTYYGGAGVGRSEDGPSSPNEGPGEGEPAAPPCDLRSDTRQADLA